MEEILPEVYVDGAHNEDGIRAFLETVAVDGHAGARTLLFGVMKDKDYGSMIKKLAQSGLFGRIAVTGMHSSRGMTAGELEENFGRYPGCAIDEYGDAGDALCELLESRRYGERIYVAGSLYLVGEIKELLDYDKFRGRIEKISSQP